MNSSGLISVRGIAVAQQALSVHNFESRQGANLGIPGSSLFRGRILDSPTSAGVDCETRSVCVHAVQTSSRPKGAGRQPFVEPQWLFPSNHGDDLLGGSEGDKAEESSSGRTLSSSQTKHEKQSDSLYYIVIDTAKDDRSSLSEPNAGILLSLIGENGTAIMQKISGVEESNYLQSEDANQRPQSSFRFQRGTVDVVTVVGPDLGRLAALWIAPEAGTWRVEKASVTILPWQENLSIKDKLSSIDLSSLAVISDELKGSASKGEWKAVFHLFQSNEALLGDDAWLPATELKPSFIEEISDIVGLQEKLLKLSPEPTRSLEGVVRLREESMKEYQNLKLSLLGFSSLLVAAGTGSLAALGQGKLAEGFAVGGVGGFLYLLLLQRAVDQLPGSLPADISGSQRDTHNSIVDDNNDRSRQPVEGQDRQVERGNSLPEKGRPSGNVESSGLKSGLSKIGDIGFRGRIVLVAGVALLLGRSAAGGAVSTISPQELLAGVVGFLTSKVAVVLTALKPTSPPEDKQS